MSSSGRVAHPLIPAINAEHISEASLLEATSDAVFVIDCKFQLYYWNRAAELLYGWTSKEAIGQRADHLLFDAGDSIQQAALNHVITFGQWSGEANHITQSGQDVIVDSRWSRFEIEGDEVLILVVNTDVTAKKTQAQQRLRKQRLESLGTLATGIAHDMNNILGPILMTLPLLAAHVKDEDYHLLNFLEESTQRGIMLMEQMVSFAHGAKGERKAVSISALFEEMYSLLLASMPKGIELQIDLAGNLKSVYGDQTQLHQIVMNLCLNARDAITDTGSIRIHTRNSEVTEHTPATVLKAKPGPHILISVIDTGIGIQPDELEYIFDPFHTSKPSGAGLGLATVVSIIKSHEGFLHVNTQPGIGTSFNVYLPAMDYLQTEQASTILIVDDEPLFRDSLAMLLTELGFHVLKSENNEGAIKILQQNKPDLVLCDWRLKGESGADLITCIANLPAHGDMKIALMTGNLQAALALNIRPDYFLSKPFGVTEMVEMLDALNINGK